MNVPASVWSNALLDTIVMCHDAFVYSAVNDGAMPC